jgi:hypothetical protein
VVAGKSTTGRGGQHDAHCHAVRKSRGGGVRARGSDGVGLARRTLPLLFIRKNFKLILIDSIKQWLPEFKNFQINHGCEGFEVRNNFSYMNFLILEKNFGLKFKEVSRV